MTPQVDQIHNLTYLPLTQLLEAIEQSEFVIQRREYPLVFEVGDFMIIRKSTVSESDGARLLARALIRRNSTQSKPTKK